VRPVIRAMLRIIRWCLFYYATLLALSVHSDLPRHVCVDWIVDRECIGGDAALTTTSVKLSYYRYSGNDSHSSIKKGLQLFKNTVRNTTYNLTYGELGSSSPSADFLYEFHQPEHGGGYCNCLDVYFGRECFINFTRSENIVIIIACFNNGSKVICETILFPLK